MDKDGLRDIDEAAEWLNIPRTTLRDMVTARRVPHTRVGRHVRFAQHHLDAIVADGEEPVATAPSRATVTAIRAAGGEQSNPRTEPPRTPPPPTGPRTPPPPTGPKKSAGRTEQVAA